jgi:hypothetical protein
MRERVEIYGGELVAGARPGGGFSVRAVLPLDARSAAHDPRAGHGESAGDGGSTEVTDEAPRRDATLDGRRSEVGR